MKLHKLHAVRYCYPWETGHYVSVRHSYDLSVAQLRSLIEQMEARIKERIPIERVNKLKRGSIITIGKNNQIKALRPDNRPYHFEFIERQFRRDSHMIVRGPIGVDNIKPRTVKIPKTLLGKVIKRA